MKKHESSHTEHLAFLDQVSEWLKAEAESYSAGRRSPANMNPEITIRDKLKLYMTPSKQFLEICYRDTLGYIKEEWQTKMMAVFFFIAHEKGFKFHGQPKLAHILV